MALIVADGNNSETANAYISLADANAYHALRNNTAWAGTDPVKEAAIVKATDFIENVYGPFFLGDYIGPLGLSWPRNGLETYDNETIPELIRKATAELALQEITVGLQAPLTRDPLLKRKKIDVLEKEYFAPGSQFVLNKTAVGFLSSLLSTNSSGINRPVIRT